MDLLVHRRPPTSGLEALCEETLDSGALLACADGLLRPRCHNSLLLQGDGLAFRQRLTLLNGHNLPIPDHFRKYIRNGYCCNYESLQR